MLDEYQTKLDDLINRRDLYYTGGWDWDNYTSKIDDLMADAQNNLDPEDFDSLQDYFLTLS